MNTPLEIELCENLSKLIEKYPIDQWGICKSKSVGEYFKVFHSDILLDIWILRFEHIGFSNKVTVRYYLSKVNHLWFIHDENKFANKFANKFGPAIEDWIIKDKVEKQRERDGAVESIINLLKSKIS